MPTSQAAKRSGQSAVKQHPVQPAHLNDIRGDSLGHDMTGLPAGPCSVPVFSLEQSRQNSSLIRNYRTVDRDRRVLSDNQHQHMAGGLSVNHTKRLGVR